MIVLMFACLFGVSEAQEWTPKPYLDPVLNAGAVVVGGSTYGQLTGGAQVGVRTTYSDAPFWLNDSRVRGSVIYGFPSQSLGGDVRVGNFIGPNTDFILTQHGPDIYFNGYGSTGAVDYYLPYSVGLDFRNLLIFKLGQGFNVITEATPGLPFRPARQGGPLNPFEFLVSGALSIRTAKFGLLVGYSRRWNQVGVTEGLILGASL